MSRACAHCLKSEEEEKFKTCGKCKSALYCGRDCQVAAWPTHKGECKRITQIQAEEAARASTSAWADVLSPAERYEWLCDCFRLRYDDIYCLGGARSRTFWTPESVCGELFVFSKLAVKNNVVPDGWCWNGFLAKAVELVKYAFEKSDVRDMYGGETIFNAMTTLRFIGEMVYQSPVVGFNEFSPDEGAVYEALFSSALFEEDEDGDDDDDDEDDPWTTPLDDPRMTPLDRAELKKNKNSEKKEALCGDVGGLRPWLDFQDELRRNPGPNIGD
mmetsp:Transcript_6638/g.11456  ORF Transcript_6638/g.11456 Transcript_6638/m.11456 type:complete len:273 (+) Transcript_6638:129-947(+)